MNGTEVKSGIVKTGYKALDNLLFNNSIITMRCSDKHWIFDLIANIIVRNHEDGKRVLYLHWVDYHKRFWTLDYDLLLRTAKKNQVNPESILNDVHFLRAFSRDNNEVKENWEKIFSFGNTNLIILDSISELYGEQKEGSVPITYAIGKFVQLCIRNNCTGIVLDYSDWRVHQYLAHVSTVIMELNVDCVEISVNLIKHPCMPDMHEFVPRNKQYKLGRWM